MKTNFAATLMATAAVAGLIGQPVLAASHMGELEAAAKAEGMLTTIALPHDWCGYGAVIDGFKAKYPGITVNELNPDAGSADEVEAIRANKDNKGPQAPDVIDVGLAFGPSSQAEGLLMPYKVVDLGRDSRRREGPRRRLVRRLLRRDVVPGEQGSGGDHADRLVRPDEAGISPSRWPWRVTRGRRTRRSSGCWRPAWPAARWRARRPARPGSTTSPR